MTSSYSIPKPISHFRIHKKRYDANEEYQREIVWSKKEKQFLIDSIIKNFAIPQIFLRKLNPEKFEIVDGQQRLTAIWQFLSNEFPLLAEYSGDELGGIKYEKLPPEVQDSIDSYSLNLVILEGYDDEDVRKLFRRLQAGKPLTPGEKLNAFPGTVTLIMRELSKHKIFSKIKFALNRYKSYQMVAQLFLLVEYGITDITAKYIYEFFDNNKPANEKAQFFRDTKRVLNYLNKVIVDSKCPEINSNPWFINYFMFSKYILDNYNVKGKEKEIYEFIKDFWKYINEHKKYNPKIADLQAIKFANDNKAGTNNKSNIQSRLDYMISKFLETFPDIELIDKKKTFDYYQRAIIFRRDKGICQNPECKVKLEFTEFHADHKTPRARGGKTFIGNGQVLCSACNLKKSDNPDCDY